MVFYNETDFSRIVLLDIPQPAVTIVKTYPTPFRSSLTVEFSMLRAGKVTMVLTDMQVRMIKVLGYQAVAGRNVAVVPGVDGLARGVYMLKLQRSCETQSVKVIKGAN